ncbi:hypothetical protein MP228_000493 [Amoeboaphelidium protococcarum]|nr:hypothetical protein MP228_000493 [Amoeboaphelidium protococcarum]
MLIQSLVLFIVGVYLVRGDDDQQVCSGDVTISDAGQLASLSPCQTYNGNVVIKAINATEITLKDVRHIKGNLQVVHNPGLLRFLAPDLNSVSNDISIYDNTAADAVDLSSLESVGSFYVTGDTKRSMKTLNLQSLKQAENNVSLWYIEQFNLTALEEVGRVVEINECQMQAVSLPNLNEVGSLAFQNNDQLQQVHLPQLQTVNGAIYLKDNPKWRGFNETDLAELQTVSGTVTVTQQVGLDMKQMTFGPKLKNIEGGFYMQVGTNTNGTSCADLKKQLVGSGQNNIVQGQFKCRMGSDTMSGAYSSYNTLNIPLVSLLSVSLAMALLMPSVH